MMFGRLLNCSIGNLYLASLLAVGLYVQSCYGSTVIYIITPHGIVIGADGMGLTTLPCGHAGPPKASTTQKIVLLKHRLALGDVGFSGMKSLDGRTILYDFPTFTKFIDYNLGPDATVGSLVQIIEDESPKILSFAPNRFKSANYACAFGENQPLDVRFPFNHYVIAGYESGIPLIYKVDLKVDWKQNRITALRVPMKPYQGQDIDARVGATGMNLVLFTICNAQTDASKIAMARFPFQRQSYCSNDFAHLGLKKASDMVRILIEIEAKTQPQYVGFPLTIVTIPKSGNGWVSTYSRGFPSLADSGNLKKKRKNSR